MKIVKNEQIAYFDVDDTLVSSHEGELVVSYYGEKRKVKPHKEHMSFMKSLKERGYYIIVHSNNGYAWAETIVKALKLEDYVDQVMSKPAKVVDDSPAQNWIPTTIWIQDRQ